jgi:hypothetical protein
MLPVKTCRVCKKQKDISHFSPSAKNRHGVKTICRPCETEYQKSRLKSNPEYAKNQMRNTEKRRFMIRDMIRDAKNVPCIDCKVSYPWMVMDFDHRPGETKVAEVSKLATSASVQKIRDEIAKCDVVCSNCHRLRTFQRIENSGSGY